MSVNEVLSSLAIGLTQGLVYGLLALGIVLVYKGTKTLNFAQPYFGLVAAFLCWWLTYQGRLFGLQVMPLAAGSNLRFLLATVLSLALIGLYGFGVEHGVVRRLGNAPRLVTLVATIALAQGAVGLVQLLFNRSEEQAAVARRLPTLLPWSFEVGTRVVTGADIQVLILAPVICAVLAVFFKRSKFGVAIRAAAENADAARLLGIPVAKVSSFTWVAGAVLAGVAGILITEVRNSLDIASLGNGFLVRALAAALVGGLTSLPGAIVGGLFVGVAEALITTAFNGTEGVPETLLFVIVLAVLLVRPGGLFGQPERTQEAAAFVPAIRELPARLRATGAAKALRVHGWALVVLAIGVGMVTGPKTTGILTLIAIYAMVGVSLTVLVGFAGQISLGHWALVGVGAFGMCDLVTKFHVPYLVALPITVVLGMVVSLVIGLPALRIRGLYLAIATLAFALSCDFFFFRYRAISNGTAGVDLQPPKFGPLDLDAISNRPLYLFTCALLLATMLLARNLRIGRSGRNLLALRENEKAAATLGIPLMANKLIAFAVSGGIAALAGALYATYSDGARSVAFPTDRSLVLIAMVMIGGLGSLQGPVLGAVLVFGLKDLLRFENPWLVPIGTGIVLLLVLIRARGGAAGAVAIARERLVSNLEEDRLVDRSTTTAAISRS
ncbi:MAG TPA: ABC transporter permease [Acidimicrobiales bacterium]|nr:ABC transporter permease [Acidimicrobiales bacterium]